MATKKPIVLDLSKNAADVKKALYYAEELQKIGSKLGFNAFQPGAIKELKMASLLGHDWIINKKDADACSSKNSDELYEYLSGKENGAGQIDRFFKDNPADPVQHSKYLQSIHRIDRNEAFYLAYTNSNTSMPLDILRIYEVDPDKIKAETNRQLAKSANMISHVSFNEEFAKNNGTLIWKK